MDTAIVTYGRGWPALTVVRSLGRKGVRVICGEEASFAPCFFSRYCAKSFRYPNPDDDPEGFLDALETVVRENRPEDGGRYVLMPVHKETLLVAEHRERFERLGVTVVLADHETMARVYDKGSLAELADELGIRQPRTHRFATFEELYARAHEVRFPAFVKIRDGAAGCGVERVDSPEELVATFREFVDGFGLTDAQWPLVQEFVGGSDHCVTALFDHGRPVAMMTYRNIRQFPRGTGAGCLRETVNAPEAEAAAIQMLEHVGWHGIAQLDFRIEDDGTSHLIELNPRFFGGLPQAVASGVDYPHLVFQMGCGETPETPVVDMTVRTETPIIGKLATLNEMIHDGAKRDQLRSIRDAVAAIPGGEGRRHRFRRFLRELANAADPRNLASWFREMFAKHRGTVNDVIAADDPLPALGFLYPVGLFLKHGKISTALLTSEKELDRSPRRGLRGWLRPNWRTLGVCAALFVVTAVLGTWNVTADNVGRIVSWPVWAADAALDGVRGLGYSAFTLLHLGFLWVAAAVGLRVREGQRAAAVPRVSA